MVLGPLFLVLPLFDVILWKSAERVLENVAARRRAKERHTGRVIANPLECAKALPQPLLQALCSVALRHDHRSRFS